MTDLARLAEARANLQKLKDEVVDYWTRVHFPEMASSGALLAEYDAHQIACLEADLDPDDYSRVGKALPPNIELLWGVKPGDRTAPGYQYDLFGHLKESESVVLWRKKEHFS